MRRRPQPTAGRIPLTAFGARVALDGGVGPLAEDLVAALPGARIDDRGSATRPDVVYRFEPTGDDGALRLDRAGVEVARGAPAEVLARAVDALHFDVALYAREASFLHASVVRWQGRLIVFPGRTGSGKSTLAAFLAAHGAIYYSDEYAPIDGEGRIVPYPKRISLRPDVRERFAGGTADPQGVGPEAAQAIVFTRFRPEARFRPRSLTSESAALRLIDNSLVAVPRPRQAAAAVARLLSHRPRLGEGARGEAEEFAEALGRWLSTP